MSLRRKPGRRLLLREALIGWALVGSLLATCMPPFLRELSASPVHEVETQLPRLAGAVLDHYARHGSLPESAPLTPRTPPRGVPALDPPGAWDHPTWQALNFRAAKPDAPHRFSFAYTLLEDDTFEVEARGDLDGDGNTSRFVLRGVVEDRVARIDGGMRVEDRLE